MTRNHWKWQGFMIDMAPSMLHYMIVTQTKGLEMATKQKKQLIDEELRDQLIEAFIDLDRISEREFFDKHSDTLSSLEADTHDSGIDTAYWQDADFIRYGFEVALGRR